MRNEWTRPFFEGFRYHMGVGDKDNGTGPLDKTKDYRNALRADRFIQLGLLYLVPIGITSYTESLWPLVIMTASHSIATIGVKTYRGIQNVQETRRRMN